MVLNFNTFLTIDGVLDLLAWTTEHWLFGYFLAINADHLLWYQGPNIFFEQF